MKIITGKLKGRNIYMPKDIRPTQNLVRKAVFDLLGQDMSGQSILDVFAGSGAVGLEAISCGAEHVSFIEKQAKNAKIIEKNADLLDVAISQIEIYQGDAFRTIKELAAENMKFNCVFIDPPYGRELAKKSLKTLGCYDIVHPNCVVIIQHEKREILPEESGRFLAFRRRKYGSTFLSLYKLQ